MQGKLIIISAPSGAGKSTLVRYLLDSGINLEFSISATTRSPRKNERHGKEYYFLPVDEFRQKVDNGEFVEWEEVYANHLYGTLKGELNRIWSAGNHVIFDVDVKGGINLKRIFGDKALSIFVMPPSIEELERRLTFRATDSDEIIKMRVEKAEKEIGLADKFDHIVINNDLQQAEREVYELVTSFLND